MNDHWHVVDREAPEGMDPYEDDLSTDELIRYLKGVLRYPTFDDDPKKAAKVRRITSKSIRMLRAKQLNAFTEAQFQLRLINIDISNPND